MEHTPKSKKKFSLSYKTKESGKHENSTTEESRNNDLVKTPVQNKIPHQCENDYSPLYIQQTQETLDQLDVTWDWNSPQSKYKHKVPVQKRTHNYHSPKQVKRHPSNNQIECYDKLRNELETLKHQLVESRDHEKSSSKALFKEVEDKKPDDLKDLEDIFNDDSIEEEMVLQSQKIEQLVTMEIKNNTNEITNIQNTKNSEVNTSSTKSEFKKAQSLNYKKNSSLDCKINQKTKTNSKIDISKEYRAECKIPRRSTKLNDPYDCIWKSFESDELENHTLTLNENIENSCNIESKEVKINKICSVEEIERKRLQALAKLKLKNQNSTISRKTVCVDQDLKKANSNKEQVYKDEVSPIKCSPEEIEQKRLQALAKLQEKKQEQIEKNRMEALKRLEINKKKRALQNLYNKKIN